jgi:F-type H+-transporting ATPase subunit a
MENITLYNLREIISPLDQFEIRDLLSIYGHIFGNIHLSLTNIGFYLIIGGLLIFILNFFTTNYNKLVSNK